MLKGYAYKYSGIGKRNDSPLLKEHKYSFKSKNNEQYIVNVEEYLHDTFIVKFHLKSHSDSKWRYSLLTNKGDARRVIYTCVDIGHEIYSKNPNASFGFIGNPTKPEARVKKFDNTKRFRVYQYFAKFFFSPENFEHTFDTTKSTYILLNKNKKSKDEKLLTVIIKMFEKYYDIDNIYANLIFED